MVKQIPNDEDIKKAVGDILDTIGPILTKLSGEKYSKKLSKKDTQFMINRYKEFAKIGQEYEFVSSSALPTNYKLKKIFEIIDKFLSKSLEIESKNPAKIILKQINPLLVYESISPSAQYAKMKQESFHNIFYKIDDLQRVDKLEKLMSSLNMDVFFSSHQGAERLNEDLEYILKPRKRFSKDIVESYLGFCKDVSSFLEMHVTLLYGFKKIIDGKYYSYLELKHNRKLTMGKMVNKLKKEKYFSDLIGMYSNNIRNSIIHGDAILDLMEKEIEFTDMDRKISLTFEEFILYVQEITRSAVILSNIENEYHYLLFKNYDKNRKRILQLPE